MIFEFHKRFYNNSLKLDEVLAQFNAMENENEEKKQLNQEIVLVRKQVQEEQKRLLKERFFRPKFMRNEENYDEMFMELENLINLLDEKIKAYNA